MKTASVIAIALMAAVAFPLDAAAGKGYKPLDRPAYRLYTLISGYCPTTDSDIRTLARNFELVHTKCDAKTIARLHKVKPEFRVLKYMNGTYTNSAEDVAHAESKYRQALAMSRAGKLKAEIDSSATRLAVIDDDGQAAPLKPSTVGGDLSSGDENRPSTKFCVTWIRIDDELIRLNAVDNDTGAMTVTRGFAGTKSSSHARDANVFCPVYLGSQNDAGAYPGGSGRHLRYAFDVSNPVGWRFKANQVLEIMKAGYDGAWLDITCANFFNLCDINGNRAVPWDFSRSKPYTPDNYREGQEKKIDFIQREVYHATGRYPCLVANNFHLSNYEIGSGGSLLMMQPTAVKPRPIDGFCIETAFGAPHGGARIGTDTQMKASVQATMRAAQDRLPALPMIGNAGGASAKIEPDTPERDGFERYGYAAYLMAVEKGAPTMFGVPACYRDSSKHRFVKVHEQYFYPIGDPIDSRPWNDLKGYRVAGANTYMRRFTGGVVLSNPTSTDDKAIALGGEYLDPETGSMVTAVDMKSQTGRILLKVAK